ncbi:MAG: TetR family transcriptional regulator [Rhizobiales bacterium]|nr:TetR family transcriptional regulator [Hyphomicrobiales bacterium]
MKEKIRRTRLAPEARRAQLLQCTIVALAEYGVARATHSHVAERAGVSVSAVHSYFRTRNDLVSAGLDAVEEFLVTNVETSLGEGRGVREALMRLATEFARIARENPDIIKVWLDWSTGVRADTWPRYVDMLTRLHKMAEKVFARGKREGLMSPELNVKAAARLYIGDGHTLALSQFAGVTQREMDILTAQIVDTFMLPGK